MITTSGTQAGPTQSYAAAAPRVSVIIPTYNTARYIGETLNALFAQSYTDFEVIVVNDGSPDTAELESVLRSFTQPIVYITQENQGPSAARNNALRAARGEYVALLDSDDYWHPEYLSTLVSELDAHPELDVVFPDARIVGDAPERGRTLMELMPIGGQVSVEALLAERCFVFVGVLARRASILELDGFDERLWNSEDFDLWVRLLHHGGKIGYRREVLAFYRRRADSLTANLERMLHHHLLVFGKMERTMKLNPAEQAALESRRSRTTSALALVRGRAAFARGEYGVARSHLAEANRTLRSVKLGLIGVALALFPHLLWQLAKLRDRFVYRSDTLRRP